MIARIAALGMVAACYIEPDAPVLHNTAFVTSTAIPASTIDGILGGDDICNRTARDAHIGGRFIAWLSDGMTPAPTRLTVARAWFRVDGQPFAASVPDILAGRIYYPLRIAEDGSDVVGPDVLGEPTPVVTGTRANGVDSSDCASFSQQTGADTLFGFADATTEVWTDHYIMRCDTVARLYCFGVDVVGGVEPPSAAGKLAFVTRGNYVPSGLAAADALCTTEANDAGHAGQFAAIVGRTEGTIAQHFGSGPYVRLDGVVVSNDLTALSAPINVTLDGSYSTDYVWTGMSGITKVPAPDENCNDWQIQSQTSMIGLASRSERHAVFVSNGEACTKGHPIYCAEL